jgi:FtsH-binding integral membrane protein
VLTSTVAAFRFRMFSSGRDGVERGLLGPVIVCATVPLLGAFLLRHRGSRASRRSAFVAAGATAAPVVIVSLMLVGVTTAGASDLPAALVSNAAGAFGALSVVGCLVVVQPRVPASLAYPGAVAIAAVPVIACSLRLVLVP